MDSNVNYRFSVQIIREEKRLYCTEAQMHGVIPKAKHESHSKCPTQMGPAQQYNLNTKFLPTQVNKAVISTHCVSAAICGNDGHNRGSRSDSVPLVIPAVGNRTRDDNHRHISEVKRADVHGETAQLKSKSGVRKRLP
jgi:hypothetical protein